MKRRLYTGPIEDCPYKNFPELFERFEDIEEVASLRKKPQNIHGANPEIDLRVYHLGDVTISYEVAINHFNSTLDFCLYGHEVAMSAVVSRILTAQETLNNKRKEINNLEQLIKTAKEDLDSMKF
ncbi:MAG: hypothetical protein PHF86_09990 [Candidatus Nanoarchaeia archaeon]|nr:hypothetical protein [Candidatus Nanoarchaeia archaeon]